MPAAARSVVNWKLFGRYAICALLALWSWGLSFKIVREHAMTKLHTIALMSTLQTTFSPHVVNRKPRVALVCIAIPVSREIKQIVP